MMFLDTSYLGALFMKNDQWHDSARVWVRRIRPPLITTDYIILELADGLARPNWRVTFARILDLLKRDPNVRIIPQSSELFERGVQLYRSREDKHWSLTDCLSFVVMRDEGCNEALTADIHFEQSGFRALLREKPD